MGLTFWVFSPKKLHRRLVTWFQMRIWLRGTVRGCWGVVGGGCKCMELVAAGWCARKWKGLDQTIRILTSGDLGVIRLGSIQGEWQGESRIPNTNDWKLLRRTSTCYKRLLSRVPFGIIYIASTKFQSTRGTSHPPAYYSSKLCGASLRWLG